MWQWLVKGLLLTRWHRDRNRYVKFWNNSVMFEIRLVKIEANPTFPQCRRTGFPGRPCTRTSSGYLYLKIQDLWIAMSQDLFFAIFVWNCKLVNSLCKFNAIVVHQTLLGKLEYEETRNNILGFLKQVFHSWSNFRQVLSAHAWGSDTIWPERPLQLACETWYEKVKVAKDFKFSEKKHSI